MLANSYAGMCARANRRRLVINTCVHNELTYQSHPLHVLIIRWLVLAEIGYIFDLSSAFLTDMRPTCSWKADRRLVVGMLCPRHVMESQQCTLMKLRWECEAATFIGFFIGSMQPVMRCLPSVHACCRERSVNFQLLTIANSKWMQNTQDGSISTTRHINSKCLFSCFSSSTC